MLVLQLGVGHDVGVDAEAAIEIIDQALEAIDEFDVIHQEMQLSPGHEWTRLLNDSNRIEHEKVIPRLELVRQIAAHHRMDDLELAVSSPPHQRFHSPHPYNGNRGAAVVLRARLAEAERMAIILGPVGPQLSTASLHRTIWQAAATLFDGGHYREAVQTAGQALESHLQTIAGPSLAGQDLGKLFGSGGDGVRLHFRFLEPDGKTYASAREGAASLIRGAMMAVRNLVSHPEWPNPDEVEALEMLAVLSYVAHLVDRAGPLD